MRIFIRASQAVLFISILVALASPVSEAVVRWNQAKITWKPVANAAKYTIYFKESHAKSWQHSVTNLTGLNYTITYLVRGSTYKYVISASDASGREFWWSAVKWLSASPMPSH